MSKTAPIVRRADVQMTEVEGELFLVNPVDGEIFHLDLVGSAIWRMLETPISRTEAVDTLAMAFPQIQRDQIAGDVDQLLDDLLAAGLVSLRDAVD